MKRRSTRHILAITIGAVIVILVAAVIVLAILLARKEEDASRGGDSGDTEGHGQVNEPSHEKEKSDLFISMNAK